jgi:cysteinyl-tRNA synthetase
MWDVIKDSKLNDHDKYFLLLEFDKVFGFNLGSVKLNRVPDSVIKLAKEREKVRKDKDWAKSDQLRDEIGQLGYLIADTKKGFVIKRSNSVCKK